MPMGCGGRPPRLDQDIVGPRIVCHPRATATWSTPLRFLLVAGALLEVFTPAEESVVPISVTGACCGEDAWDAIGPADVPVWDCDPCRRPCSCS